MKYKIYAGIVALALTAIIFSMGAWYGATAQENNIYETLSLGVDKCESQNQVFRMYKDGDSVKAECYGEKPAVELHTSLQ